MDVKVASTITITIRATSSALGRNVTSLHFVAWANSVELVHESLPAGSLPAGAADLIPGLGLPALARGEMHYLCEWCHICPSDDRH